TATERRLRLWHEGPPVAEREYNRAAGGTGTLAGGLNGADRHRPEPADRRRGPPHLRKLHRAPRPLHLRRHLRGGLAAERRRGIPPRRARRGPPAPRPGAPVARWQLRPRLPLAGRRRPRRRPAAATKCTAAGRSAASAPRTT